MLIRRLPCRLSQDEWSASASALAQAWHDLAMLDVERKLATAALKQRLELLEAAAAELGGKVRTHEEMRDVEVFERPAPSRLCVEIYRADTGELVDTRPMTAAERDEVVNPRLPGVVAAKTKVDA